eukprot:397300_1
MAASTNIKCISEWASKTVVLMLSLLSICTFMCFPIMVYKTFAFNYDTDIATFEERPYRDNVLPFSTGYNLKNEFGEYFGVLVSIHSISGTIGLIAIALAMFVTTKGSKYHKYFGILATLFITVLLVMA